MTIHYTKDPAMYSDLFFSIALYFNLDNAACMENFVNPKKRSSDMKYFRECAVRFGKPAEELSPFFTVCGGASFSFGGILQYMIRKSAYNFDTIEEFLPNSETMKDEVCRFFFGVRAAELHKETLASKIDTLELSSSVKYHLLAIFLRPQSYYDILMRTLRERLPLIEKLYKDKEPMLQAVTQAVDVEFIRKFVEQRNMDIATNDWSNAAYSITLINRNAIRIVDKYHPYLILGSEYLDRMNVLIGDTFKPDIVKMGKALSEEKRVMILQMLLVDKEVTAQQILQRLKLSMTAAHYHLEMLLDAGMLLTRNEGRTIFYSLNRDYFDRAPLAFEEFSHAVES